MVAAAHLEWKREQRERINLVINREEKSTSNVYHFSKSCGVTRYMDIVFVLYNNDIGCKKCPKIVLGNQCRPKLLNGTKFLLL